VSVGSLCGFGCVGCGLDTGGRGSDGKLEDADIESGVGWNSGQKVGWEGLLGMRGIGVW
jgi:hypothetical protein